MKPPCCFTIPYTVGSPSPVPLPTSFVVKKGSKTRDFTSSSIPSPVSEMERQVNLPFLFIQGWALRYSSSKTESNVSIIISPPSGIASLAFVMRFIITCSTCPLSAMTGIVSPRSVLNSIVSGISLLRIFSKSPTTDLRNKDLGSRICLRLKARSPWVNVAARSEALRI
ncbi:hypothetical protein BMS3Bbin06_00979 [bacterium BMS3Bbin06]|nr:hypothetical protein BMS3Bbin06_00979 [bacterium BMS3Bbin06]